MSLLCHRQFWGTKSWYTGSALLSGGFSFRNVSPLLVTGPDTPERKPGLLYWNLRLPVLTPEVKGTKSRKYCSLGVFFFFGGGGVGGTTLLTLLPYSNQGQGSKPSL